jgi:XapX domain-containing protein
MKLIIGLILAVCVGIGCRWFGIPLPGPPAIMGAAMAVAMASGYTATDYWLSRKSASTSTPMIKTEKDEPANGNPTVNQTATKENYASTKL